MKMQICQQEVNAALSRQGDGFDSSAVKISSSSGSLKLDSTELWDEHLIQQLRAAATVTLS